MILILASNITYSQSYLKIDYPDVSDTAIQHYRVRGVEFYSIDFYNSNHQIIKEVRKTPNDNHHVKWEDRYDNYKVYYIYNETILEKKFVFDYRKKTLSGERITYGNFNKLKKNEYLVSNSLTKNCLQKLIDGDYYLNHPEQISMSGWILTGKEERNYLYDTLIASRKYFSYNNVDKKLLLDRIDSFVYNKKGQLIEYLSLTHNSLSSNLMQTFDYDCNDRLIKCNYYEDGRFQSQNIFSYTDTSIIRKSRFFIEDKNNPYNYNEVVWIYIKDEKSGKFYCKQLGNEEFKLPNKIN